MSERLRCIIPSHGPAYTFLTREDWCGVKGHQIRLQGLPCHEVLLHSILEIIYFIF